MEKILYIFWHPSSQLWRVPGTDISLQWYGLMWALGFILSRQVGIFIFERDNRYLKYLPELFFYISIPAVIGARLGHFLFYDFEVLLLNPLKVITPPFAGMASHGGVAGILIGVLVFCKIHKWNYLWVIDRLAIVALIPGVTIRLGNLINSEILGKPADLPWAFIFAKVDFVPRHPAQLYEALSYFFLFLIFFYIWNKHSHQLGNGLFLGSILAAMWTTRFLIEFVKIDQVPFENGLLLNIGQVLSIPFIIFGLWLVYYSFRKGPDPYYYTTVSQEALANHQT